MAKERLKSYTDKLPRLVQTGNQCQRLDRMGRRCKKQVKVECALLFNGAVHQEFDDKDGSWLLGRAAIELCLEHTDLSTKQELGLK